MLRCQETLRSLRETEAKRQQETWKSHQPEARIIPEAEEEDSETDTKSVTESEKMSLENTPIQIPLTMNGMSETTGGHDVGTDSNGSYHQFKAYKWIKMGKRGAPWENEMEEEEELVESQVTNEQCSRRASSVGNIILVEDLPDVDYPTNEDSTLQPHLAAPARKNSTYSDSGDMETFNGTWWSPKNLVSPGLQRKRPVNTFQAAPAQMSNRGSTETLAASHHSSSLSNDSDYNLNSKRDPVPPGQSRVLKLGSLKPNQGMFWSMHDDSPTLSDLNSNSRMSNQTGTFIPNIGNGGGSELHLPPMSTSPQEHDTQTEMSRHNVNEHPSILEGLLERAKDRVRERNGLKQDNRLKMTDQSSRNPSLSPSFYPPLSPSPSEGDQETEGVEKEVRLVRHRAATVSERWKEQLVDEDNDERRNGSVLHVTNEGVVQ